MSKFAQFNCIIMGKPIFDVSVKTIKKTDECNYKDGLSA